MSETKSKLILATAPLTEDVNPFALGISAAKPTSAMYYTSAKLDDDKNSLYVVYSGDNYTSGQNKYKIIEKSEYEELGFSAKSAQGWGKTGITVFGNTFYGGEGAHYIDSDPDVTAFPLGIQSFIVRQGTWQLKDSSGKPIVIDGKNEFGPTDAITNTQQMNMKSIERINKT